MENYDYLYKPECSREKFLTDSFSTQKLHFKIIKNGTYLPIVFRKDAPSIGGIVDGYGNFLKGSFVHSGGGAYVPQVEVPYIPFNVIYMGMISATWGHAITDSISRIWFLKSDIYKEHCKDFRVVYGLANNGILPTFARLLQICGIDINNWFLINRPMKFQNIIVPDRSWGSAVETGGGVIIIKTAY